MGLGCRVGGIYGRVLDFIFSVEDYGDDVFLFQAQKNLVVMVGFCEELGVDYLRTVVVGVAVVVLEGGEGLGERDIGDEDGAGPVMDKGAWWRGAGWECAGAFDDGLALL